MIKLISFFSLALDYTCVYISSALPSLNHVTVHTSILPRFASLCREQTEELFGPTSS
jgi:DeoR/GlpR family transcriptional regulator of sugar metabolism